VSAHFHVAEVATGWGEPWIEVLGAVALVRTFTDRIDPQGAHLPPGTGTSSQDGREHVSSCVAILPPV
jgi:hypothetical protein